MRGDIYRKAQRLHCPSHGGTSSLSFEFEFERGWTRGGEGREGAGEREGRGRFFFIDEEGGRVCLVREK